MFGKTRQKKVQQAWTYWGKMGEKMFENLFKKCAHEYKQVGYIPATAQDKEGSIDVPCYFLECKKCGKRRVLREPDFNYTEAFLEMINLWKKGEFKINFKEYQEDENDTPNEKEKLHYKVLNAIESELQKLQFEMSDSENRLVVNNIKALIHDALSVEVV